MHTVAGLVLHGFGGKVRPGSVAVGNGIDHVPEGHGVIRGFQCLTVTEIDLILAASLFMMGAFRIDSHLFQGHADFPADVLSAVCRSYIHVARVVIRDPGALSFRIIAEKVEFLFRSKPESIAFPCGVFHGPAQESSGITGKRSPVRPCNITIHADDSAMFRPPGEDGKGSGIGMQENIRCTEILKPGDGPGVYGNAFAKGPVKFGGHDRYIFGFSENIAEGKPDKFYILFFHKLLYFLAGVFHKSSCK